MSFKIVYRPNNTLPKRRCQLGGSNSVGYLNHEKRGCENLKIPKVELRRYNWRRREQFIFKIGILLYIVTKQSKMRDGVAEKFGKWFFRA